MLTSGSVPFAWLALGVAWPVIAVLVLAFTAHAALRLTGLDPLGFVLGNSENAEPGGRS